MAPKKGKKAWRTIDATDVDAFRETTTFQERRGPAVDALPDADLFVIDTAPDEAVAVAKSAGKRSRKEAKPLRSELILKSLSAAKPVLPPRQAPKSAGAKAAGQAVQLDQLVLPGGRTKLLTKRRRGPLGDLWGDELDQPSTSAPAAAAARHATAATVPEVVAAAKAAGWLEARTDLQKAADAGRKRPRVHQAAPLIKPVEVDAAGCSFNPDPELHQDAVAELVAAEMKKIIRKELEPSAPPPAVPQQGAPLDELAALQVDAEATDEEDGNEGGGGGSAAERAARRAADKKTRQQRNRQERHRAAEREAEERRRLKKQRRELDALPEVQVVLAEAEAAAEAKRQRRAVVAAEKAAAQPPRLGKHKFEPEAVQVLTSDELTGSLRQLKPCFVVARDRFKSLQKRGAIEVRKYRQPKGPGKKVVFEKGARREKAEEAQEQLVALRKARVAAQNGKKAGR